MMASLSARRQTLLAIAIFVALTLLFFRQVIFSGLHYTTTDVRETAGAVAPLDAALQEGVYPLWNPYIFSGMPSYASLMLVPYRAASLIDRITNLPFATPRRFALVLHFIFAGLGTFVYLRWRGTDVASALLGGLAFEFSVHVVSMATGGGDTKLMTIGYLPWAMWAVERLLALPSPARAATLALVLGMQLLSTHVQMAYYTWLAVGLCVLYWIAYSFSHRAGVDRVTLPLLLAALAVGLALAAVLYLPIANYTPYSIRGGASGLSVERAAQWSLPPWELLTFVAPHLFCFGGTTYWGGLPFNDIAHYGGIVVLSLAIVAVVKRLNLQSPIPNLQSPISNH